MSDPAAATLVGLTLGDKFFVRREIGRGGMGTVYEVEHVLTKRVGALKLLQARRAAFSRPEPNLRAQRWTPRRC